MTEVGPSSEEDNLSAAEPQPRHDFSVVQGFQVVGAEDHGAARSGGEQAWGDALRLELEARAARFHQAVDAAIVLSNDGIIRWLGDPVARLSVGPDMLNPGAVIFADESLAAASRETIKTRIELWIAATTRRILAPLFALEAVQEGPEAVRDLAHTLARSLGILEREPIRAQINALSQNDRAELRKHGVRFGAYYLFVPALIKPAPRSLALQLWGLRAPGDANELLRALGPVASSGRTSLSLDRGIPPEGYHVAGYRPCGERIVRVDIIERLAGMIRAAIVGEPAGVAPERQSRPASKGFVVSGQMTSLTGCAGEQFASILRSMGFRAVELSRSEFFGSSSGGEARGQSEPLAPTEVQGEAQDPASSPVSDPAPDEDETTGDPVLASLAPASADSVTESVAPPLDLPVYRSSVDSSDTGASAETASALPSSGGKADMIIVWRPDRRRSPPNRRETEGKQSRSGASSRFAGDGPGPVAPPQRTRNKKKPTEFASGATVRPASPDRPHAEHADEKRRQRPSDYDMPRSLPPTAPPQRAKVDPNSPFAKLLELRSLLEEQANKRP
jgi:ATP-dependent RNA helicase SUPV3L1/SUV3